MSEKIYGEQVLRQLTVITLSWDGPVTPAGIFPLKQQDHDYRRPTRSLNPAMMFFYSPSPN